MAKKQSSNKVVSRSKASFYMGLILLVALFFLALRSYSGRLIEVGQKTGEATASVKGTATTVVSNGVVEIRVGKLETAMNIPKVYEVDKGSKALCLETEVKNISGSEKKFIPLVEIKIEDENGKIYDLGGVLTCSPGVGGPIQTGEVISGKLGFLVPDEQHTYTLKYIPIDNNTKSFIISGI